MQSNYYTIKDLENFSGVKAHTIRIWEQRYGILSPSRTDTNLRRYSNNDLKHLLNITMLSGLGYKISRISEMSQTEIRDLISKVADSGGNENHILDVLKLAMLNYDEKLFHQATSHYEENHGFRDLFTSVLMPFMHQVGLLWQSEAICPAQEHFISNLIRQKIFARIELLETNYKPDSPLLVLYLPEPEIHEISLLMLNYLLKSEGYRSLYLGLSVPFDDLLDIQRRAGDVQFVSVLTSALSPMMVQDYFRKIKTCFEGTESRFHFTGKGLPMDPAVESLSISVYPSMEKMTSALLSF